MKRLLAAAVVLIAAGLGCPEAFADETWISITLKRSPILDKKGNTVERPVHYARNRHRLTRGGEWVLPEALKAPVAIERYQTEAALLLLVDVPTSTGLPGAITTAADAEMIKKDVFAVTAPPESGVTAPPESGVTK